MDTALKFRFDLADKADVHSSCPGGTNEMDHILTEDLIVIEELEEKTAPGALTHIKPLTIVWEME